MKEQNCLFCHHQSTVRPQITQVDSFEFVEGIRAPKQTPNKHLINPFMWGLFSHSLRFYQVESALVQSLKSHFPALYRVKPRRERRISLFYHLVLTPI